MQQIMPSHWLMHLSRGTTLDTDIIRNNIIPNNIINILLRNRIINLKNNYNQNR